MTSRVTVGGSLGSGKTIPKRFTDRETGFRLRYKILKQYRRRVETLLNYHVMFIEVLNHHILLVNNTST